MVSRGPNALVNNIGTSHAWELVADGPNKAHKTRGKI